MIRTFPEYYKSVRLYLMETITLSVQYAERIMSSYSNQDILPSFEARRTTVKAIKEWMKVFKENNVIVDNMQLLIAVTAVFSQAQLDRAADAILGFILNAIKNELENEYYHSLFTVSDGQCCGIIQCQEPPVVIENIIVKNTLKNALSMMSALQYLMK